MKIHSQSLRRCKVCGAVTPVTADTSIHQCVYCNSLTEIPSFSQENRQILNRLEETEKRVRSAADRLEQTANEFARTGSSDSGALYAQAQQQHTQLLNLLKQQYADYENGQTNRLEGWFRLGEEAQHARRYDEAIPHYHKVLSVLGDDAETHWRVLLCRYGVEYVLDGTTQTYLPTLTRIPSDDLLQDADYLAACRCAKSDAAQTHYIREGQRIADIIDRFRQICATEEPYDVFISCKQSDNGQPTADHRAGEWLCDELTKRGLRVFYSQKCLIPGELYEPHIMYALTSARMMIVAASTEDYLNSRWVRNEWRRFSWLKQEEGLHSPRRLILFSLSETSLRLPAEIGPIQMLRAYAEKQPMEKLMLAVGKTFPSADIDLSVSDSHFPLPESLSPADEESSAEEAYSPEEECPHEHTDLPCPAVSSCEEPIEAVYPVSLTTRLYNFVRSAVFIRSMIALGLMLYGWGMYRFMMPRFGGELTAVSFCVHILGGVHWMLLMKRFDSSDNPPLIPLKFSKARNIAYGILIAVLCIGSVFLLEWIHHSFSLMGVLIALGSSGLLLPAAMYLIGRWTKRNTDDLLHGINILFLALCALCLLNLLGIILIQWLIPLIVQAFRSAVDAVCKFLSDLANAIVSMILSFLGMTFSVILIGVGVILLIGIVIGVVWVLIESLFST